MEIQFWASALLLNLAMMSDEIKQIILQNGGLKVLLEMAVSGDENELAEIATNATRTLVVLGFVGKHFTSLLKKRLKEFFEFLSNLDKKMIN